VIPIAWRRGAALRAKWAIPEFFRSPDRDGLARTLIDGWGPDPEGVPARAGVRLGDAVRPIHGTFKAATIALAPTRLVPVP
jgi:hypothetical protein